VNCGSEAKSTPGMGVTVAGEKKFVSREGGCLQETWPGASPARVDPIKRSPKNSKTPGDHGAEEKTPPAKALNRRTGHERKKEDRSSGMIVCGGNRGGASRARGGSGRKYPGGSRKTHSPKKCKARYSPSKVSQSRNSQS